MKAAWQTKTLAEVCQIKPPKAEARRQVSSADLVSFAPMEDLGIDRKYLATTRTKPFADVAGSYTYFADGDVLLAKITPCFENGKLGIAANLASGIGFGSSEYIVFRPKPSVDKEWLYYYLSRESFRMEGAERMTGAVGHKRVAKDFIETYPIPLPPLAEQRRIIGILDQALGRIATAKSNVEKNIRHVKALFEAGLSRAVTGEITKKLREGSALEKENWNFNIERIIQRIKGSVRREARSEETTGHEIITNALPKEWKVIPIGTLFNLIDYRGKNPSRASNGRRLITAKNIKMGYLSDEPEAFISEETYKKWMVRGFPKVGDILFVTEGHTMGFVALNTLTEEFALAQRTITLQPIIPFNTKFIFYFMMSSYFQEVVKLNATGSAAVGMKASKFRSLPLPFPSDPEQQVIVKNLDALLIESQRLESIYKRKLSALDDLKKSLLHQAFSGRF